MIEAQEIEQKKIDMRLKVSDAFKPLLLNEYFYLILVGGRGSGKSEFAGTKLFYRCQKEGNHRFLIMRKVRARCKESVIELMLRILEKNYIDYSYNKSDRIITFWNYEGLRNELLFDGIDDPEKIKSIKGITGIWLEETTEFTKDDFLKIDLSFREPSLYYKQMIMSFNPDEAVGPWLKEMFFDKKNKNAFIHKSTIEDNPIKEMRDRYRERLDDIDDEILKLIYRYGEWALPKGIIYNWDIQSLPDIKFDEVFYGGDFGYSVNPAAVIKIYRKADEFWVQELIYKTGLTNIELADEMRNKDIGKYDEIYFDSSEPKSIDEIIEQGFNIKPAQKGPDSVRAGIDYLKSLKIHITDDSPYLQKEVKRYKWKEDKSGNPLPEPVKFDDHGMDAIRYGIFTHMKQPGTGIGVGSWDIRPD